MMKKLLLADDSITIQKVVGIIFSTEEYQLEMTDDGDSAFKKALEDIPDLVIADISMPGKDGFELCRAIKNEPSLSNTSVMLLPGAFDHFDEIKAGEVCADGWLTKPFESQALLDKVSQLLEVEPVKMSGVAAPASEKIVDEVQFEEPEVGEDLSVTEAALGLDEVDELKPSINVTDEDSPDDIWDAVSFAEEDLQEQSETTSVDPVADVSFAADVIDPSAVDDVDIEPATDEQVLSAFAAEDDENIFSDNGIVDDFVEEYSAPSSPEEFKPEPFVDVDATAGEQDIELSDQLEVDAEVDLPVPAEEAESVDFSVFSEEEDCQPPTVDLNEEPNSFVSDAENDESFELVEELDEDPVVKAEESDFSDTTIEAEEPLELIEDDLAEQNSEVDIVEEEAVSFAAEPDDKEVIMELQEEDELDPEAQKIAVAAESTVTFGETVEGAISENDEVLDLSVDEIIEDEAPEEEIVDEAVAMETESFEVEKVGFESELEAEPVAEKIETFVAESIEPEVATEHAENVVELAEEEVELAEEEVELAEEEVDDEDFYFDAAEEDATEVITEEVRISPVSLVDVDGDVTTEKIEQQLRELSEEELKEVVAKVAGPIIEKLAGEMVEQIAWEVVPDLAEAMISEEIRKIKEGT